MRFFLGMISGALLATFVFFIITMWSGTTSNEDKSDKVTPLPLQKDKPERESVISTENALTILMSGGDKLYYYRGKDCRNMSKTKYSEINDLVRKEYTKKDTSELMILIKSGPGSTFKNAIDILDAMTLANVAPGHYAETEITNDELNCLKNQ